MKLLFIGNVGYRFNSFAYSSLLAAKELNIEFHIAGNWTGYDNPADKLADEEKYGIKIHQIDFIRRPYDLRNIKAYKQIVELINREKFDAIHCNTPIGGVVGRLAGKRCGITPVIYQAHGFHFYKGAPLFNWLVYYPIERWLARYTDALITINHEDYELAQKFHLRDQGNVYYVPGVGIETSAFEHRYKIREAKRSELGLNEDDIAVISAGDLIERKNYKTSIEAIAKTGNKHIHYFICGQGHQKNELENLAHRLNVADRVHFLGFRTDIKELFQAADIFLLTSLQEGLPRSLMEAMASGLPCIASKIRGNIDLVIEQQCGFLANYKSINQFAKCINWLADDPELRRKMSIANMLRINEFDINTSKKSLIEIYKRLFS